jgi:hypothetical protein
MKTLTTILSIVLLGLAATAGTAGAEVHLFEAIIDGSQEVPPSGSTATGFASLTYDDITGELSWEIQWSGLSGPPTGMHFHGPAPAGVNAGIQIDVGIISGLTSPSIGSTAITAAQGDDLLSNLWYVNIHAAQFPAGEIRGQIERMESTPTEPASWSRIKALYR